MITGAILVFRLAKKKKKSSRAGFQFLVSTTDGLNEKCLMRVKMKGERKT